jgi:hypothetical protein
MNHMLHTDLKYVSPRGKSENGAKALSTVRPFLQNSKLIRDGLVVPRLG